MTTPAFVVTGAPGATFNYFRSPKLLSPLVIDDATNKLYYRPTRDGAFVEVGGGGGSAALSLAELNLGAAPVRSGRVTLTDAAIQATDKLSVSQAPGPYTGKGSRADEAELSGPITFTAVAGTGSATVYWSSPFVQRGNVKVHYTRG